MNISISFLFKAVLMKLSFTETVNLRLTKQFTERLAQYTFQHNEQTVTYIFCLS